MIHLYAPKATNKAMFSGVCADCKKRTRFLSYFIPWYGWDTTCIKCGRRWIDGEWMDLPFIRSSRERSIDRAKKTFRRVEIDHADPYGLSK